MSVVGRDIGWAAISPLGPSGGRVKRQNLVSKQKSCKVKDGREWLMISKLEDNEQVLLHSPLNLAILQALN